MLYVSDIKVKGIDKYACVTDTDDNITEEIKSTELAKIVKDDKFHVYGASYCNYDVELTKLTLGVKLNEQKLVSLTKTWKERHNPYTEQPTPIQDYLATLRQGTTISVISHEHRSCWIEEHHTELLKVGIDRWKVIATPIVSTNALIRKNAIISSVHATQLLIGVWLSDGGFEADRE